jgi:hypothetical protein
MGMAVSSIFNGYPIRKYTIMPAKLNIIIVLNNSSSTGLFLGNRAGVVCRKAPRVVWTLLRILSSILQGRSERVIRKATDGIVPHVAFVSIIKSSLLKKIFCFMRIESSLQFLFIHFIQMKI